MKKRLLGIFTMILVLGIMLIGCSGNNDNQPVNKNTESSQPAESKTTESNVENFEGTYVVDAAYLKEKIGNEDVILIDARGKDEAKKGTVEGAIAVVWQDFATVSAGKAGDAMWGTIQDADTLSKTLGSLGIAKDKEIILFGGSGQAWGDEGRILWTLNAAGYENIKMVDRGYDAIVVAGVPTVKGAAELEPVEVEVSEIDASHIINTEDLKKDYVNYKIVDVRSEEEYNGATLYGEANGGHLPGAINIPFTDFFNEDNTLKSNLEIEKLFTDAGITKEDKVVTYCTKGIRSAYAQLVLEMLGYENTLNYDESFYRWSAVEELE